jgi:hypothetical protein
LELLQDTNPFFYFANYEKASQFAMSTFWLPLMIFPFSPQIQCLPGRMVDYAYSHPHENAFVALSFPNDFVLFPIRLKAREAVRFLKFQDFLLVDFFAFIPVSPI